MLFPLSLRHRDSGQARGRGTREVILVAGTLVAILLNWSTLPALADDPVKAMQAERWQAPASKSQMLTGSLVPPEATPPASAYPSASTTGEVLQGLQVNQEAYDARYTQGVDLGWHFWPDCPCQFFIDAGFYMFHPYFSHNPAFSVTHGSGAASTIQTRHFDYDVEFGPHIVFGFTGPSGFGFRASWFQFDFETDVPKFTSKDATLQTIVHSTPVAGIPGFASPGTVAQTFHVFNDQLTFNNHVRSQVWDWEATKEFNGGPWTMLVAGGMRYGYLSQSYHATRLNSGKSKLGTTQITVNEDSDTIFAGRNFGGVGPTSALDLRREIGHCGFAIYATARGSVLFGRESSRAFQETVENVKIVPRRGPTRVINTSMLTQQSESSEESVPMGDFEVGVSWTRTTGRASFFLQAGFVSQTWFDAGSATIEEGHFSLYGLRWTGGFRY